MCEINVLIMQREKSMYLNLDSQTTKSVVGSSSRQFTWPTLQTVLECCERLKMETFYMDTEKSNHSVFSQHHNNIYRVVQKVFVKMASRSDERDVNISQKLSHNAQLVHVMTNHTNESDKNTKINCNNLTQSLVRCPFNLITCLYSYRNGGV